MIFNTLHLRIDRIYLNAPPLSVRHNCIYLLFFFMNSNMICRNPRQGASKSVNHQGTRFLNSILTTLNSDTYYVWLNESLAWEIGPIDTYARIAFSLFFWYIPFCSIWHCNIVVRVQDHMCIKLFFICCVMKYMFQRVGKLPRTKLVCFNAYTRL